MNAAPTCSRCPLAVATTLALLVVCAQAGAQEAADASAKQLDTVVVTAGKRSQDIREVPVAISVVDERLLENINASQLSDYASYVPGLQIEDGGAPGMASVSLRGVASLASNASVGTYIDEVPLGSSSLFQAASTFVLDYLPFELERIEALRGPQGTLYGASTMGGLLKYVTRKPNLSNAEFRIGAGVSVPDDASAGWNARFSASLPLQPDRLGLAVGYAHNDIPGVTDNALGGKDIDSGTQDSAYATLYLDGDAFDLKFSAMRQRIDMDGLAGVALDPQTRVPLYGDHTDMLWIDQPLQKDLDLYSLSLNWDLGFGEFVSASGWSKTDTFLRTDSTIAYGEVADLLLGLPEPGRAWAEYALELEKFTQEFRLASKADSRLEWMLGAFYTKEDAMQYQSVFMDQRDGTPLPSPLDELAGTLAHIAIPSTYKETALFANAAWNFTDRFKLGAGLRQSWIKQTQAQIVDAGILLDLGEQAGSADEDVFTWSVSPQFQLTDDVMAYARVATGYQPGGPNAVMPGMPASVDSSTLTSHELGLKAGFADGRGWIDAAVFRVDWEDIQVPTVINGVSGLVNGGEAKSEGVELGLNFKASDDLRLGLNAAYTRSELKDDFQPILTESGDYLVEIISGRSGDKMPYVPKLSWSATAEYSFDIGNAWTGRVGGAYRYSGSRINATSTSQRVMSATDTSVVLQETITSPYRLDSYRVLDLYAGFGDANWDFRLLVNNVTDEEGYSSLNDVTGALSGQTAWLNAVPIRSRTFALQFDYRF